MRVKVYGTFDWKTFSRCGFFYCPSIELIILQQYTTLTTPTFFSYVTSIQHE